MSPRDALIAAGVVRPLGLRYDRESGVWYDPRSGATAWPWVNESTLRFGGVQCRWPEPAWLEPFEPYMPAARAVA